MNQFNNNQEPSIGFTIGLTALFVMFIGMIIYAGVKL